MKPNAHPSGLNHEFTLALLPLLAALAGGVGRGADSLPSLTIPQSLGFNVHLTGPDQEWDKIKEAGVKFVRKDFAWDGIERAKGQYNFGTYDRMLDSLDKRGLRAVFILDYRNRLYPEPETSEEGRDAFAKWAAESVKHFKGRQVLWEIWNEPNVGFWHGKGGLNSAEFADEYVALVKKAVPAMRAADPDCYILGGSVSCLWRDSFRWIDQTFKQGLLNSGISALSVHPYGFPRPELCLEVGRPDEGYKLLHEKMAKAGAPKDFPVLGTEVGYSRDDRNVGPRTLAPEHQAMLFVRTYLVDLMDNIRLTIWYNWDGDGGHEVRGPAPGRPVYRACKNLVAELGGYHYVERLRAGSSLDYVLAFENAAKHRKLVAWTTPQARDDSPDKAKAHEVSVPTGTTGGPVPVRDLFRKSVAAKVTDGSVALTLSGSPQYVDCVAITGPVLWLEKPVLDFAARVDGASPAPQTITLSNIGVGVLGPVTISADASWLTTTLSGTIIANAVNTRGLKANKYTATVTVSGGGTATTYEVALVLQGDNPASKIPDRLNIALGKKATASSAAPWESSIPNQTTWDARYANDGDDATRWCPDPHDVWTGHWWKVDLGKRTALGAVEIHFEKQAAKAYQYKIDVSADDVTYTPALDLTTSTTKGALYEWHAFPPSVSGRYVRWTCTGGFDFDHWPTFHEFRLSAALGDTKP
jgi:polysaccharide biosynthesis protein PslG